MAAGAREPRAASLCVCVAVSVSLQGCCSRGAAAPREDRQEACDHGCEQKPSGQAARPTFCASTTYWATMKGENTRNSSARAATWLYIRSRRRAHSSTTGRSSALPVGAAFPNRLIQRPCILTLQFYAFNMPQLFKPSVSVLFVFLDSLTGSI